ANGNIKIRPVTFIRKTCFRKNNATTQTANSVIKPSTNMLEIICGGRNSGISTSMNGNFSMHTVLNLTATEGWLKKKVFRMKPKKKFTTRLFTLIKMADCMKRRESL